MPNPPPIQQRIEADLKDEGFKKAARQIKAVGDATQKSGEQAQQASPKIRNREQKLRDLREQMVELIRVEDRHEREVNQGTRADERATAASRRRKRQIDRIGGALRSEQRIQERASAAVAGHKRQLGGLATAARGVLPALGAGAGILGAYRLIKAELDAIIDRQEKAFRSQVTLASAQRSLRLNLAGQSSETVDKAFAAAERISLDSGVGKAAVTLALAEAVSSTGGDLGQAEAFTDLATKVRPDRPSEVGGISGALGDTANAIDTTEPKVALGFFLTTASLSRIANSSEQFSNIPVALKGLVAQGFTPAEAGSLFAAQTNSAADTSGRISGTALLSFGSQANEFFDGLGRSERGGSAVAALQQDRELAEQFLESFNVERKAFAPIAELLRDPESQTATLFRDFQPRFGSSEDFVQTADALLAELSRGEVEKTAEVGRRLDTAVEALQSGDLVAGRAGAVRSNVIEVLKATGDGALATTFESLDFNLGGALNGRAVKQGISLLKRKRDNLLHTVIGEGSGHPILLDKEVSPLDQDRADILQTLIDNIEDIGDVPASPPATITNVTNINGTIINQALDPTRDDLEEGRPVN